MYNYSPGAKGKTSFISHLDVFHKCIMIREDLHVPVARWAPRQVKPAAKPSECNTAKRR